MRCSVSEYTYFTATPPIIGANQGMTLTVNTDLSFVYIMTFPIIRANRGITFMVNNNLMYTFCEVQIGMVIITNV